jgi:hypothetical protein
LQRARLNVPREERRHRQSCREPQSDYADHSPYPVACRHVAGRHMPKIGIARDFSSGAVV